MERAVDISKRTLDKLERIFSANLSNLGKLIGLISTIFAFSAIATNKLSNPINVSSFLLVRGATNFQISASILSSTKQSFCSTKRFWFLVILRSLIGCACAYLFVLGIYYLEVNHFYSIVNTQPIVTFWLGYFFMGETYKHDRFVCTLVTVLGVALIVNPDYIYLQFHDTHERYENFYLGLVIGFGAGALKAVVLILVKKISGETPFKIMMVFEGSRVAVPAFVLLMSEDIVRFRDSTSLFFALLSGVIEYVYQILSIVAMRYERASVIGIIETLSIVFSFFFDVFVMGKAIHFGSVVGTLLIVTAALYLTNIK